LHSQDFETYQNRNFNERVIEEQNDLMSLAISSDSLLRETERIYDVIVEAFEDVIEYSKKFQHFIDFHYENLNTNYREYSDHESFQKAIIKHQEQEEEIEHDFNPICDLLIFRLDANSLRSEIRPSPGKCLMQIRSFLPELSLMKLKELLDELEEASVLLRRIPSNVNEFVEIMKYLEELDAKMDSFTDRFQQVEQLHIVMDTNKIKIPEKNNQRFKDTLAALKHVRNKLEECVEAGDANEVRFKKELDNEIPRFQQQIEDIQDQLNDPVLKNKDTPLEDNISLLRRLEIDVNAIRERGKLINDQQRFLEIPETSFDTLDQVLLIDFNLKKKLWNGLRDWNRLTENWVGTVFREIDVENIQNQVDEYDKIALQCVNGLEGNELTAVFQEAVEAMKSTMPVVSYLRNENLQDRHWEKINEVLKMTIDTQNDEFTLQSLIDLDVKQNKDEIGEIALRASKEAELQRLFDKVREDWKTAKFEVNPYKEKECWVISSTEEFNEILEESLVTLSTILSARF
jgi:dynein heavy chain